MLNINLNFVLNGRFNHISDDFCYGLKEFSGLVWFFIFLLSFLFVYIFKCYDVIMMNKVIY